MDITRRDILKAAIGTLTTAAVGGGVWAYLDGVEKRRQKIEEERRKVFDTSGFSLDQLASELDSEKFDYRGFPTRIREACFELTPVVHKDSSGREIVVIAEKHDTPEISEKVAGLIYLLVARYGFDSIGFENFYGPPSPNLKSVRDADIKKEIGDTQIDGGRIGTSRFFGKEIAVEVESINLLDIINDQNYQRFLRQQSVPTYGIEDRQTLFDTYKLLVFGVALENIFHVSVDHYGYHRFESIPTKTLQQL